MDQAEEKELGVTFPTALWLPDNVEGAVVHAPPIAVIEDLLVLEPLHPRPAIKDVKDAISLDQLILVEHEAHHGLISGRDLVNQESAL